ncbi:acyl-CoA dehydrogenase [Mycolicibacter hiberniae]|uniref:Acyl-CoA dehydrogenase n=1 Tax=Mycolicibacter hiberniae TaxID=29314 RepID=A0A7I7WVC0_9MYCO|nr:acyl-CoA dehydrogenase [Mycolicibacter hiberniae]
MTLPIDASSTAEQAVATVEQWIRAEVPEHWRAAAEGPRALRTVRTADAYRRWYPTFASSGLVVPGWQPEHGGLGVSGDVARAIETALAPLRLTRLNPLGLNNTAAALFSHGTEQQRLRFLPPIVRNEEKWCQLFSEPGAGSDLASLATRAVRDGDEWVITGQKVWTTWADEADFGILLARTDPELPKHRGITYFLLDMHQSGVDVRPLRQITGEREFNEVFLDGARVPDAHRVGDLNDGWRVSASTLSVERQMVSGSGSGGMGRLGGSSAQRLIALAQETGRWADPVIRTKVMRLWAQEQVRGWTNARYGRRWRRPVTRRRVVYRKGPPGHAQPADSGSHRRPGGTASIAWPAPMTTTLPRDVQGWMRSLANGTEGGTTDINKNILGERVLGLPKARSLEGKPWKDIPRS